MASADPTRRRDNDSDLSLGEKVHDDLKTRQAQANGNSDNCIEVNITKFGKDFHGIEVGELLAIEVREQGIVIKTFDDE